LGDRVANAVERCLGGEAPHPRLTAGLGFLRAQGHPARVVAARLDDDGDLVSAAVVAGANTNPAAHRRTARRTRGHRGRRQQRRSLRPASAIAVPFPRDDP